MTFLASTNIKLNGSSAAPTFRVSLVMVKALMLTLCALSATAVSATESSSGNNSLTVSAVPANASTPAPYSHGLPARSKLDEAANKLRDRQQYCFDLVREQQKAAGRKDTVRLAALSKQRAKVCNY